LVDYHWGIKSKFKLEVGLKNNIDFNYPDIIWFPQGIYVINSFNTSHNTNSYSISINGKDKMCMLNGELGGSLTASIDFSKMEDTTVVKDEVTEIDLPIETIIREAVHTWGGEDYHNIVINDLKEQALELLSYNGEEPLYLFYSNARGVYINYTTNGAMKCYLEGKDTAIDVSKLEDYKGRYDPRVDVNMQGENIGTDIWFVKSDQ
jgi:hypothetical protein